MITKEIAQGSSGLAMMLAAKGKALVATTGTPLEALVKATEGSMVLEIAYAEGASISEILTATADTMEFATDSHDGMTSPHDLELDAMVEQMSFAVRNHISFARNTVGPAVTALCEILQKSNEQAYSPDMDFKIEIWDLPAPLANAGFEESIKKYKGASLLNPERSLALASATPEELLTKMMRGSKDFDETLAVWFASREPGFFLAVWDNLFRDVQSSRPAITGNMDYFLNTSSDKTDAALAIYLWSGNLLDNVAAEANIDLPTYRRIVGQYQDRAGAALAIAYDQNNSSLTSRTLIRAFGNGRRSVIVNGPVYRDWIKSGGKPEILMGLMVTDDSFYAAALIDDRATRYAEAWRQFSAQSASLAKNKKYLRFREAAIFGFNQGLTALSQSEMDLFEKQPGTKLKISDFFTAELNNLTNEDVENPTDVALRLVCRARFFYTSAEQILRSINEAIKGSPELDIRDAAALAVIEYLADFVSDQICLVG